MKTPDLARLVIADLRDRISSCEASKNKLLTHLEALKISLNEGKISYEEFLQKLSSPVDGKTIHGWISYYDAYIKDCERRINEQEKKISARKVFLFYLASSLSLLLQSFMRVLKS
jgi:hypothetical protein